MELNPKFFLPSGYNDRFTSQGLPFSDYIRKTQTMLKSARIDLTAQNANTILHANSPYEWLPTELPPKKKKRQRGILLIHGLFDAPFGLMDFGRFFVEQGFVVRSILLPGHGTVPGDLLNIEYPEWMRAVDYAVESLQQTVEEVFIMGFSLGGALALHKTLRSRDIAGLILLAPALSLQHSWLVPFLTPHSLVSWASPTLDWVTLRPQKDYAKYESYTINSALQTARVAEETHELLKKQILSLPIFAAISIDDETVDPEAVIEFFNTTLNVQNRLWLYGTEKQVYENPRIEFHSSYYPEQKILNFSHMSLPFAPGNPHYGQYGDYKDFLHYPHSTPPPGEVFLGAKTKKNLEHHVIQRLTYNPDFAELLQGLQKFLQAV